MHFTTHDLEMLATEVAVISRQTGAFLKEQQSLFHRDMIQQKGFNDLVSHVDQQAEQILVSALQKLLPEAGFIAEEGTGTPSESGLNWVVDPLDGTTNFMHNIPFYCTSVALVQNEEPILGVIYDPEHNEMYVAIKGGKAFCNEKAISVSPEVPLESLFIVTGFPYDSKQTLEANLKTIGELTVRSRGIRRMGSAALDMCYVAAGRFDGFYEVGLNPWDVAAGTCIVRSAGGLVDDFRNTGKPVFGREIIAASPGAFREIQSIVGKHFVP